MDLEGITLSEISQTEKDKYRMISLICGIKRAKQMNKQNKWVVARGEGVLGGKIGEGD